MTKGTITIVGLGPGAAEHLSLDALQRLAGALADIVSLDDLSSAYRRAAIKQFVASCERP